MKREEALSFLRDNQPLPPTKSLPEETLRRFREVLDYFQANPSVESIPLLLNSFGEGDGHGVYLSVEDAIIMHPKQAVIPHLLQSLSSKYRSVRFWCAQIALRFPDPILFEPLSKLFLSDNEDERSAAFYALNKINIPEAVDLLEGIELD